MRQSPQLETILSSMAGEVDDACFRELLGRLNTTLDEVALGHLTSDSMLCHHLVDSARIFGIAAHAAHGVVRAGSNLPYSSHCAEVACILGWVTKNPPLLAAAWLHDVIEDTSVTRDLVCRLFGKATGKIVWSVTCENTGLVRRERLALFRLKLAGADPDAQSLKVCDIISNGRRIRADKPDFAPTYLIEKKADLQVLTRANPMLLKIAARLIDAELAAGRVTGEVH